MRLARTPLLQIPVLAILVIDPVAAIDQLAIDLGTLAGSGWTVQDAQLTLDLRRPGRIGLRLSAKRLALPAPLEPLEAVELVCAEARLEAQTAVCPAGVLRFHQPMLDAPQMPMAFRYGLKDGSLKLAFHEIRLAKGRVWLEIETVSDQWTVEFKAQSLDLAHLRARLAPLFSLPPGWDGTGVASGQGRLSGTASVVSALGFNGAVKGLTFEGALGRIAGESLGLELTVDGRLRRGLWWATTHTRVLQGAVYAEPVFVEVTNAPIRLDLAGAWDASGQRLHLDRLEFDHPGILKVEAQATLSFKEGFQVDGANLRTPLLAVQPLYETYVKPFFVDTALEQAALTGKATLALRVPKRHRWAAELILQDVAINERSGRYQLEGLQGKLVRGEQPAYSSLRWRNGQFYRLPFGAAELQVLGDSAGLQLVNAVEIPVFDGALVVETFEITGLDRSEPALRLNGVIKPVDLERVTEALGFIQFPGKVSAIIPDVTFQKAQLAVNGALLLRAFDGDIVVRDLKLGDPLGPLPTLDADVAIRGLDLESLTRTFSFGKMEGRLDGRIAALRLENWRPMSFDARFATPEGDRSRHRISQRAVDNLSSLGGPGVSGLLSRSFLRFFEDFSYDRLGLSCRLRNGVCEMDGIEPAKNGYYIVKGGGLPRINVVGYIRRVDWDDLVARLQAMTTGGEAVVR